MFIITGCRAHYIADHSPTTLQHLLPVLLFFSREMHFCSTQTLLIIMSTLSLLKQPYVEIYLNKSNNILVAKWIGFLKPEDVRTGCAYMTKYIKENNITGHLSDHRQLKVLSKEVQDYLTRQWFPEVEKVGLRKVGAVVAEDVFAAATVNKVNKEGQVGNLSINMFNSEIECVKWILN
jgi:hypothetical protein